MRAPLLAAFASTLLLLAQNRAQSEVVRPAADVAFPAVDGRARSLKSYRGQPVILLLAKSPSGFRFKRQLEELANSYDRFANRNVLFAAAFQDGSTSLVKTDIPMLVLPEGAKACEAFELKGRFLIAIIGPDGNLDYKTTKILSGNRVREVLQNTFLLQKPGSR